MPNVFYNFSFTYCRACGKSLTDQEKQSGFCCPPYLYNQVLTDKILSSLCSRRLGAVFAGLLSMPSQACWPRANYMATREPDKGRVPAYIARNTSLLCKVRRELRLRQASLYLWWTENMRVDHVVRITVAPHIAWRQLWFQPFLGRSLTISIFSIWLVLGSIYLWESSGPEILVGIDVKLTQPIRTSTIRADSCIWL